jgi:hypothetical protein
LDQAAPAVSGGEAGHQNGEDGVEIAAWLRLGPATVKTHVASILHKHGRRDRVQAVVLAYETGLAQRGDAAEREHG